MSGPIRPGRARTVGSGLLVLAALTIAACASVSPSPSVSGTVGPPSSGPSVSQAAAQSPSAAPPVDSATTIDACALLSPTAVAAIVGGPEPVGKALPAGGWVAGQCSWSSPVGGFLMSVGTATSIAAFADPAAPDAAARLAAFRQRLTAVGTARNIAGLGDGAVLGPTGIAAYRDGTYLEILRLTLTDEQLIEVAKATLSKL